MMGLGDWNHIQYKQQAAEPDPGVMVPRACRGAGCCRRRTRGHTGTAVAAMAAAQRSPSP